MRACVGARRVSSSSKHIPYPSKHVRLSAGPGAATPNLLPRAGEVVLEAGEARAQLHREDARPGRLVPRDRARAGQGAVDGGGRGGAAPLRHDAEGPPLGARAREAVPARGGRACGREAAPPLVRSAMIAVLHILRGYLLRCQRLCVLIASVPSEGVHEGRLVRKNNAPWQSGAHICQVVARRMCIVSLLYMGVRGSLCNACRCGRYAVAITLPRGARIAWPPFESFHGGMLLHRSRDPQARIMRPTPPCICSWP